MPLTLAFKQRVALFLCLINSSVDRCENGESRFGSCSGCQFTCFLDSVEHCSAPGSGDLREEHVFNRVPLGGIRWIMGDSDVNTQSLRQLDEPPFELPAPCVVRATSIAEDEYGLHAWNGGKTLSLHNSYQDMPPGRIVTLK